MDVIFAMLPGRTWRKPEIPSHSRVISALAAATVFVPAHATPAASSTVDFADPFGPTRMVSGARSSRLALAIPRRPSILSALSIPALFYCRTRARSISRPSECPSLHPRHHARARLLGDAGAAGLGGGAGDLPVGGHVDHVDEQVPD